MEKNIFEKKNVFVFQSVLCRKQQLRYLQSIGEFKFNTKNSYNNINNLFHLSLKLIKSVLKL